MRTLLLGGCSYSLLEEDSHSVGGRSSVFHCNHTGDGHGKMDGENRAVLSRVSTFNTKEEDEEPYL